MEALELPQGTAITGASLLATFTPVPDARGSGDAAGMRLHETLLTVGGAPMMSHSINPPNGRCWTTTRFPRTSA